MLSAGRCYHVKHSNLSCAIGCLNGSIIPGCSWGRGLPERTSSQYPHFLLGVPEVPL